MSDETAPDQRLAAGLAAAAAALERGDMEAAAEAFEGVVAACADCVAKKITLTPEQRQATQRLHDRCSELAASAQISLNQSQSQASASNRARKGYSSL